MRTSLAQMAFLRPDRGRHISGLLMFFLRPDRGSHISGLLMFFLRPDRGSHISAQGDGDARKARVAFPWAGMFGPFGAEALRVMMTQEKSLDRKGN